MAARQVEETESVVTCGICLWIDAKWRGSTCRSKGITEDSEACSRHEEPLNAADYRGVPCMVRARKALKHRDMLVPLRVREELKGYLTASGKTYQNTMKSRTKSMDFLANLQAYRDRTVSILDDLNVRITRIKHLKDGVRLEVSGMNDVSKQSTAKARDALADEIMRPILKRYDYLKDLSSLATSTLFSLKDAVSMLYIVFSPHQGTK